MLAPIPYFDVAGYKRRSIIVPTDIDLFVSNNPGYIEHRIARGSSLINARLKKRYAVPLGQNPPLLVASGTNPPAVGFSGRPTLGSLEMVIQITTGGPIGTSVFQWSQDGGEPFVTGVLTAATVSLGTTGLVAIFPSLPYATDNAYEASTPVPEIALGWLVSMLDVDVWSRRGTNPNDPAIVMAKESRDEAIAEMREAADSHEGLFDLPTNDAQGDSAVTQGGPMSYTEASPYVWQDIQRDNGRFDDHARSGDTGSTDS